MFTYGCLALLLLVASTAVKADDNESCYSFAGGSVYPAGEPKGDHQLQYTKAVSKWPDALSFYFLPDSMSYSYSTVSKPAPQFEATAVVNKEIVQLSLSQYLGKYVVLLFYPLDL